MKAKKTNHGFVVIPGDVFDLMQLYETTWRRRFAQADNKFLFVTFHGDEIKTPYLSRIVTDNWKISGKSFSFTQLRKTAHTMYDDMIDNNRIVQDLFCSGAGHTFVFFVSVLQFLLFLINFRYDTAQRHYILATTDKAVKFSELLDQVLAKGLCANTEAVLQKSERLVDSMAYFKI